MIWFSKSDLRNHSQNCQAPSCAHILYHNLNCTLMHVTFPHLSFIMCFIVYNFAKTSPLIIHWQKCHLLLNDSWAADRKTVGPPVFWSFHYVYRSQEQLLTNLLVVLCKKEPACAPAVVLVRESNLHFDRLSGQEKRQHEYNNSSTWNIWTNILLILNVWLTSSSGQREMYFGRTVIKLLLINWW